MAHGSDDYHRGEMDIAEHKSMYAAFDALTRWGSLTLAVGLLLFTLWFCVPTGFVGALIPSLVLAIIGVVVLRKKPDSSH